MSRTNIDIDDEACGIVMQEYGFATKRDAVNFALRRAATEKLSLEEAQAMRGAGWEGNLSKLRGDDNPAPS